MHRNRRLIRTAVLLAALLTVNMTVLALEKSDIPARDREAQEFYDGGEYGQAARIWMEILEIDPGNDAVKKKLEDAYEKKRSRDKDLLGKKKQNRGGADQKKEPPVGVDDAVKKEPKAVKRPGQADASAQAELIPLKKQPPQKKKKGKTVRIDWDPVEGAVRYRIQIQNSQGAVVLEDTVDTDFFDFALPPGKYRYRIGALTVFEKIDFWTDWEDVEIQKAQSYFFANRYIGGAGVTARGGWGYTQVLPAWSGRIGNSIQTYTGNLSWYLGAAAGENSGWFRRHAGFEISGIYGVFSGATRYSKSELTQISGTAGLFLRTAADLPVHGALHLGAGMSYSKMKVQRKNYEGVTISSITLSSMDPAFRIGVSGDLNFLYYCTLTIGVDYHMTLYQDQIFHALRYYAMLGIRF